MKKLLLAASVFVIASCTASISIKAQFSEVQEKWGERALFSGIGLQLVVPPNVYGAPAKRIKRPMTLYVNQETGTWTLVSFWTDNYACLVANGRDFVPGGSSLSDEGKL